MFQKLKELREESENGFTLIELLVVILIIGILSAIAIPAFLNQRKSAVDASVQSDVTNAAKQIENWIVKQGATPKPLPAKSALSIVTSDGVTLEITGTTHGYCVIGTNPGGDISASDGFVYASEDGGMSTKGKNCAAGYLTDADLEVPSDGSSSGDTPSDSPEGSTAANSVHREGQLFPMNGSVQPNIAYTLDYSWDPETDIITYTLAFDQGVNGDGYMWVQDVDGNGYDIVFTAVDGVVSTHTYQVNRPGWAPDKTQVDVVQNNSQITLTDGRWLGF